MTAALSAYFSVFALVVLAGGIIGFVKAKSRASLIAGLVSAALLIASATLTSGGGRTGIILGTLVCVALAGRFLPAYLKTKKLMPAGLVAVMATGGALFALAALLR
jgi:uncharacterized membrane protein (UPF0136 family)